MLLSSLCARRPPQGSQEGCQEGSQMVATRRATDKRARLYRAPPLTSRPVPLCRPQQRPWRPHSPLAHSLSRGRSHTASSPRRPAPLFTPLHACVARVRAPISADV
eukprot:312819-Prymnesium_polylepis.1